MAIIRSENGLLGQLDVHNDMYGGMIFVPDTIINKIKKQKPEFYDSFMQQIFCGNNTCTEGYYAIVYPQYTPVIYRIKPYEIEKKEAEKQEALKHIEYEINFLMNTINKKIDWILNDAKK